MKPASYTSAMPRKKSNRYYLMRHGQSEANRQGIIVSRPENAIDHYGLTTKGAEQVMASALNTRLDRDTIIVSSDYKRAIESARIVKSVIDCQHEIIIDKSLRERDFGNWELKGDEHYASIWHQDVAQPSSSMNGVETVNATLERGLHAIELLETQFNGKKILLVSHGDVLQILLTHYHNINPRFHRSVNSIGNADIRSLTKLDLASKTPAA